MDKNVISHLIGQARYVHFVLFSEYLLEDFPLPPPLFPPLGFANRSHSQKNTEYAVIEFDQDSHCEIKLAFGTFRLISEQAKFAMMEPHGSWN